MSTTPMRIATAVVAAGLSIGLSRGAAAQIAGAGPSLAYRATPSPKPPRPKAETDAARRAPHSADAVWIPGYWQLQGNPMTAPRAGWVWVPGGWDEPPMPGAKWVEGHWGWNQDWWTWLPGHWDTPTVTRTPGHG